MAMRNKPGLLPDAMKADLQRERANLQTLLGQMDQAESCGVECQAYRESAQALLKQLDLLIQNGFSSGTPVIQPNPQPVVPTVHNAKPS